MATKFRVRDLYGNDAGEDVAGVGRQESHAYVLG